MSYYGIGIGLGGAPSLIRGPHIQEAFSPAALDYFARLDDAGLRIPAADGANAYLIDALVEAGGGFWPDVGAFCAMAGYLYPGSTLVPLHPNHDAGTLVDFVTGDWNAKTGLKGDGIGKYVNSNRNNNADGQDDHSMGVFLTEGSPAVFGNYAIIGAGAGSIGSSQIVPNYNAGVGGETLSTSSRSSISVNTSRTVTPATGLVCVSRNTSTSIILRANGANGVFTLSSVTPYDGNIGVFARESGGTFGLFNNMRASIYHVGPALGSAANLERMDDILTEWMARLDNAL